MQGRTTTTLALVLFYFTVFLVFHGAPRCEGQTTPNYWNLWIKEAARLLPADQNALLSQHLVPTENAQDRQRYYEIEADFWNAIRENGFPGPLATWGSNIPIVFPKFLNSTGAATQMLGFTPGDSFEKLQASDVMHALYLRGLNLPANTKAELETYLIWTQYVENVDYYFDTFLQSYIANSAISKILIVEALQAMLVIPPETGVSVDIKARLVPPPKSTVNFNRDKDIGLMVASSLMAVAAVVPIVGGAIAAVGAITTGILSQTVLKNRDETPNLDVKATVYAYTDMSAQGQNVELARILTQLKDLFDSMQMSREESKQFVQDNWVHVRTILARPSVSYSYLVQENILFEKMLIARLINALFTFEFVDAAVPSSIYSTWYDDRYPMVPTSLLGARKACYAVPVQNQYARWHLGVFDPLRERIRAVFGENYWLGQKPTSWTYYADANLSPTEWPWSQSDANPNAYNIWKSYQNATEASNPMYVVSGHTAEWLIDGWIPYCNANGLADLQSFIPGTQATVASVPTYRESLFSEKMYFSFDNPSNPADMPFSAPGYFANVKKGTHDPKTATYVTTNDWRAVLAHVPKAEIEFSQGNGFVNIPSAYTWSFNLSLPVYSASGALSAYLIKARSSSNATTLSSPFAFAAPGRAGIILDGVFYQCSNVILNSFTSINAWNTFVVTAEGTNTTFYRNGAYFCTIAKRLPVGGQFLGIQGDWAAIVDDVRYWNVKLTPSQISTVNLGYACRPSFTETFTIQFFSATAATFQTDYCCYTATLTSGSYVAKSPAGPCSTYALNAVSGSKLTFASLYTSSVTLSRHWKMSLWFKTPLQTSFGSAYNVLMSGRSGNSNIAVHPTTGRLGHVFADGSAVWSTLSVSNLRPGWHHLAYFEYASTTTTPIKTYATYAVDGVSATIETYFDATFTQDLWYIGGNSAGNSWGGQVTDIRIWNSYPASEVNTTLKSILDTCYRMLQ